VCAFHAFVTNDGNSAMNSATYTENPSFRVLSGMAVIGL
jgi:hypothetical protein